MVFLELAGGGCGRNAKMGFEIEQGIAKNTILSKANEAKPAAKCLGGILSSNMDLVVVHPPPPSICVCVCLRKVCRSKYYFL